MTTMENDCLRYLKSRLRVESQDGRSVTLGFGNGYAVLMEHGCTKEDGDEQDTSANGGSAD